VSPGTGLNDVEKKKFCPYWDSKSGLLAVHPVVIRDTNCAVHCIVFHTTFLYISMKELELDFRKFAYFVFVS
jgi:hypothetical protein